jgi:CubicO group peptidase (beta-lactamase class C family)
MALSDRGKPQTNPQELQQLIDTAFIPGISFASVSDNKIEHAELGLLNAESKDQKQINSDTQFWACSLSKPVFAYLVLKLIEKKQLGTDFNLKTPLPWDESFLGPQGDKKPFTVEMILSHQTGLPNEGPPDQISKDAKPGELFRYSGEGYLYLQKFILAHTEQNSLDDLAKQYVFDPLEMSRSTFSFPEHEKNFAEPHNEAMTPNPTSKMHANDNNAAGSLHTTASDYARFLIACLNDVEFIKLLQIPQIGSMEKDIDSKFKVSSSSLSRIDWGLGFGLQKDANGEISSAFHWGHGPGARTFFVINFQSKSAVVYLTNSENGLAIARQLTTPIVGDVTPAMNFLSEKYNYRSIDSAGWKEYHDYLIAGAKAEQTSDWKRTIELYSKAAEIVPENPDIQYHILLAETHQTSPVILNSEELKKIEGQYGPVKIFIHDSTLKIEVGGERRDLKIINNNTFLDDKVVLKIDFFSTPPSLKCHFPGGGIGNFNRNPERSSTAILATTLKISPSELKHSVDLDRVENKDPPKTHSAAEMSKEVLPDSAKENTEISKEKKIK